MKFTILVNSKYPFSFNLASITLKKMLFKCFTHIYRPWSVQLHLQSVSFRKKRIVPYKKRFVPCKKRIVLYKKHFVPSKKRIIPYKKRFAPGKAYKPFRAEVRTRLYTCIDIIV
jgi:hypothetical protein